MSGLLLKLLIFLKFPPFSKIRTQSFLKMRRVSYNFCAFLQKGNTYATVYYEISKKITCTKNKF